MVQIRGISSWDWYRDVVKAVAVVVVGKKKAVEVVGNKVGEKCTGVVEQKIKRKLVE